MASTPPRTIKVTNFNNIYINQIVTTLTPEDSFYFPFNLVNIYVNIELTKNHVIWPDIFIVYIIINTIHPLILYK